MSREHDIQNYIREQISRFGKYFRTNVGTGWTGSSVTKIGAQRCMTLKPGTVIIEDARPFSTGLPAGYSDLSGVTPVTITQDMVGQTIGIATFIEVKQPGKKPTADQINFLTVMRGAGAFAGVAHDPGEALDIVGGRCGNG